MEIQEPLKGENLRVMKEGRRWREKEGKSVAYFAFIICPVPCQNKE